MASYQTIGFTIGHVVNSLGTVTNLILLYMIAKKSPKSIKVYTVLLFNFAATDLMACIFGLFVAQRMIPCGTALLFTSGGFCKLFNRETCYVGHCFSLTFYSHSFWSNLLSFSYRYAVLHFTFTPRRWYLIVVVMIILIPSVLQSSFCAWYALDVDPTSNLLEKIILTRMPNYTFEGDVLYGTTNVFEWRSLQSILFMCLPILPVYSIILYLRNRILKRLQVEALSEMAKKMHRQLLAALTAQSSLPGLYTLALITYMPSQLGFYSHPLLEQLTFAFLAFVPMLGPLTNLYFIQPYRKAIIAIFKKEKRVELRLNTSTIRSNTTDIEK